MDKPHKHTPNIQDGVSKKAPKSKILILFLYASLLVGLCVCYVSMAHFDHMEAANFDHIKAANFDHMKAENFDHMKAVNFDNMKAEYLDRRRDTGNQFNKYTRPSHSFPLWQSLRLHPEDKKGRSPFHRYGEPLPLYKQPGDVQKERTGSWTFVKKSNAFVTCSNLFLTNRTVSDKAQENITKYTKKSYRKLLKQAKASCKHFTESAGYITDHLTKMEAEFPIAFSMLIYKDIEQFELLLRTIYRPQNVYCVHVDKKSPAQFHKDVHTLVSCFDNIFMTPYSVDVRWSMFTNLEPEVICLRELWKHKVKWKYFINLTGQEFPLRTNYELVKILTAYGGANNVESDSLIPERLANAGPVPYSLTPVKGQVHVTLSRAFVDFLLHNETSLAVYDWSRNVRHPDEIYFSTLNYNAKLRAPGSYKGKPKSSTKDNPFIARLKHWKQQGYSCHGKLIRLICIFGTQDLPLLATREELFANKLNFDYHPAVMLCMQELLYNRTAEEYEGSLDFNVTYYATRDFVKNRF